MLDEDGRITGYLAIRTDITSRKRQEEELQRTQSFLNSVIEHLPVPIFIKEAQNLRFVLWNRAGEHLTGIPTEEIIGRNDGEVFPAEEAAEQAALDQQLLATRAKQEIPEQILATRRHGPRTVHVTRVPIQNAAGEVAFILGIAVDITERKQAEARMAELNSRLLESSRYAGMAEVATGVLHNVGNVLNSVNVSSQLLADRLKRGKSAGFAKVAALLREQSADLPGFFARDSRAAQLPGYLERFAGHLVAEQAAMSAEVENLRRNVEHIKDIVAMQQNYARFAGVTETIRPADLVEHTLCLNRPGCEQDAIEVVREIEAVPAIEIDKHKVLQILVNLVRNARHACAESGRPDKRITLAVRRRGGRVVFDVRDNGVGIPPENMPRIFNHGFTTRPDGHGFGLHSSANAATEMGGAVMVRSDGPGCGATFTLELPLSPPARCRLERESGAAEEVLAAPVAS
jgi:PAS domain S-box-containing protein